MWDRIVNFVHQFIGEMSNTTFYIVMGVIITLGFYFLSLFLKANKKEEPKAKKLSMLFMAIFTLVVFIIMANIRKF